EKLPTTPGAKPDRLSQSRKKRWQVPQPALRRVSEETRTPAHRPHSSRVVAMDCENRKGDRVLVYFSCHLSCRAKSRHLLLSARKARKRKQEPEIPPLRSE